MSGKRVGFSEKLGIPIWQRTFLTVEEAAGLTGLGKDFVSHMTSQPYASDFMFHYGSAKVIKREAFLRFLNDPEVKRMANDGGLY